MVGRGLFKVKKSRLEKSVVITLKKKSQELVTLSILNNYRRQINGSQSTYKIIKSACYVYTIATGLNRVHFSENV